MGYSTQGPQTGTWVPTFTGFSADPGSVIAKYILENGWCTVFIQMAAGTSNATTFTMTLPFTVQNTAFLQAGYAVNNGASIANPPLLSMTAGSNILSIFRDGTAATWTASNGKSIRTEFTFLVQ